MIEALFILTVIFVAYVVYSVTSDFKKSGGSKEIRPAPKAKQQAAPKVTVEKVAQPAAKAEVAASAPASKEVRNPETGETAAIPSNYRFTKRWIKDALVTEGLLDKVYKNNELDDAASAKVKAALEQFRMMEKYQP